MILGVGGFQILSKDLLSDVESRSSYPQGQGFFLNKFPQSGQNSTIIYSSSSSPFVFISGRGGTL
ncbi:unnamed protein product [marine sediment metagenome]|uniref:Uncharacterized protein n=1 Tax=marine sediment metagenome TaxID=412755 RepID=X1UX52_9ZZZZ